jgi:nitroreductase
MGTAKQDSPGDAREKIAFLRSLRQLRQLRPNPLPEDAIQDILDVARWSGSAGNSQPWAFVVVRDRGTLQKLSAISQQVGALANAALGMVLVMNNKSATENYDEGRLTERIMLAAHAYGIGAAIGWLTASPANAETARQILGIPADRSVRTIVALGYPATEALQMRTKPGEARKPLNELVHEERF